MLITVVEVGAGASGLSALAFSEWEPVERVRALSDRACETEGIPSAEQCRVWCGGDDVQRLRVEARLVDDNGRIEVGYVGGRMSSDDNVMSRYVHAATMHEAKDALVTHVIQRAKSAWAFAPV